MFSPVSTPEAKKRAASTAKKRSASFPEPPHYVTARRRLAGRDVDLDWRKLARRRPAMWPGLIRLFTKPEARRRTAFYKELLERDELELFFIGTNNAGVLFALDREGQVMIVDEVELDFPVVLAPSFEGFARSMVEREEDRARLERAEQKSVIRGFASRWRRVDALAGDLAQTDKLVAVLLDLWHDYRHAGREAEYAERMRAFRKQHASRTGLLANLRKHGLFAKSA